MLFRSYNFFALYANIDGFTGKEELIHYDNRTFDDRWIISKLNSLILIVEEKLDSYDPTKASREINRFINDDLSNWYIRLNRKRFWKGDLTTDKLMAYQTLFECLMKISTISSPFIPFYSEKLFADLNEFNAVNSPSVHLLDFPEVDQNLISQSLERKMSYAQDISSLVHSIRKKEKIRVRQPLSKIFIPISSKEMEKEIRSVENIILSEVNVKEIEYVYDTSKLFIKKIKPNYKLLGSLYGKDMNLVASRIMNMTQEEIFKIESDGFLNISFNNNSDINLKLNQVEILFGEIEGKQVASNEKFTLALDITLTDDLIGEGIAREFINKIQNERKNISLDVTDKISIYINKSSSFIFESLMKHKTFICSETQALDFRIIDEIITSNKVEFDLGRKMDKDSICFKISKS